MHATAAEPTPNRFATTARPRNQRARITTDLFKIEGVHRQSLLGRRYEDLVRSFVAALGGSLSEAQRTAVRRAAELTTLVEHQRAKALRNEPVDALALVRLENMAARAVRDLGIKPTASRGQTLAEYLASKAAAAAGERSATSASAPPHSRGAQS